MGVEHVADRADAAVHHVARCDDVGAGLDVRQRRAREQLDALVVVHLAADDHATVSVRRVLAQADVRHQHELGEARAQRTQRALHDPVVLPRTRRLLVLLLGDAEEHHGLDTPAHELLGLPEQVVDAESRHARQRLVAQRIGGDEERHDERLEVEARLAHEPTQGAGAPEAAEPDVGVRAHGERVRLRTSG